MATDPKPRDAADGPSARWPYDPVCLIARAPGATVVRARREGHRETVLLELLARPTAATRRRVRRQFEALGRVERGHVVAPVELVDATHRAGIVYEDPGGPSLAAELARGPLDVAASLEIGVSVAEALGRLHAAGIVHDALRPEHVLVPSPSDAAVVGFSRIRIDEDDPGPTLTSADCLAFTAPELTARSDRPPDGRADLYSLGAILYRLLVGRTVFDADDPLDLAHCHLARQPEPPSAFVRIAPVLSDIVMRLLAKQPDDRYQTARAIKHDLERCVLDLRRGRHPQPFHLGERDSVRRPFIPERLYGRTTEIGVLHGRIQTRRRRRER
jgi:serine/threonine protein kinase